jgi:solute carrier family 25 ornithine transporter 2/15
MDIRDTVSGGVGAVCCVYAGLPFDITKLRMQTRTSSGQMSVWSCISSIARTEGLHSLWRGAFPALGSAVIENAVLFTANGAITRACVAHMSTRREGGPTDLSLLQQAGVGAASGFFSATVGLSTRNAKHSYTRI